MDWENKFSLSRHIFKQKKRRKRATVRRSKAYVQENITFFLLLLLLLHYFGTIITEHFIYRTVYFVCSPPPGLLSTHYLR